MGRINGHGGRQEKIQFKGQKCVFEDQKEVHSRCETSEKKFSLIHEVFEENSETEKSKQKANNKKSSVTNKKVESDSSDEEIKDQKKKVASKKQPVKKANSKSQPSKKLESDSSGDEGSPIKKGRKQPAVKKVATKKEQ